MSVNHVGLCVRDIDVSRRFYGALGFVEALDMEVPDEPLHTLLRVPPPLGLRAVYLRNGPFVLELLGYTATEPRVPAERTMTEIGLTHLSIGVDDLATAKAAVIDHGGEVLADSDVGVAVMVRDPDGQLIELLDRRYRPVDPDA